MSAVAPVPCTRLQGPSGSGEPVEGIAIVSSHGFNARYDMDRDSGLFSRPEHDLYGQSAAGKIYVFTTPKGGIATSWALLDLKSRGIAPLALVCRQLNPIVAQGAVLADIAVLDRLAPDPVTTIRTGDRIRLDPRGGTLEILRRADTLSGW